MEKIIQIPFEDFQTMHKTVMEMHEDLKAQQKILEDIKGSSETHHKQPDHLNLKEFLTHTKMSRWKFDILREQKKIDAFKVGRKIYIHRSQVDRYFTERPEID